MLSNLHKLMGTTQVESVIIYVQPGRKVDLAAKTVRSTA